MNRPVGLVTTDLTVMAMTQVEGSGGAESGLAGLGSWVGVAHFPRPKVQPLAEQVHVHTPRADLLPGVSSPYPGTKTDWQFIHL